MPPGNEQKFSEKDMDDSYKENMDKLYLLKPRNVYSSSTSRKQITNHTVRKNHYTCLYVTNMLHPEHTKKSYDSIIKR